MTEIRWIHGETRATCRMCGDRSVKQRVVEATVAHGRDAVIASRCGACMSFVLTGDIVEDTTPHDGAVDCYIEQFAGIGSILDRIVPFADQPVRRFADVGCNFGFGVDIARRRFGWHADGFDPSYAAARGARDLTARIHQCVLDADTDVPGGPYDLMLCSEVLEHVADPAALLRGVLAHLDTDGTLVLTTPSAGAISPSTSAASVTAALSPGYHRFVASKSALDSLLTTVGLTEVDVIDDGETLVAVASRTPAARRPRQGARGEHHLMAYLDALAEAGDVAPIVRTSAAARHFKQSVLRGMIDRASASRQRFAAALIEGYRLDLDDLEHLEWRCEQDQSIPAFLSSALFADGMLALNGGEPALAARRFEVAVYAWQHLDRMTDGALDLETAHMGLMAAGHRLIALASAAPQEVQAAVDEVDYLAIGCNAGERRSIVRLMATAFTGLVSVGAYLPADRLAKRVEPTLESLLTGDATERRAGLDALFCLAMLALQSGRHAEAEARFAKTCEETAGEEPGSHGAGLFAEASRHITIAVERQHAKRARGGIVHDIDVYWADARGIYLAGFAFVPGAPGTSTRLRWGDVVVEAGSHRRHDGAAAMFPNDPAAAGSGFGAYLTGPLTSTVSIEVSTASAVRCITIELPTHPIPDWPQEGDFGVVRRGLLETFAVEAPSGPIVALGVRGHDASGLQDLRDRLPGRTVVGLDVHPGPGVDLVGDAHTMTAIIEPGSVAGFISDDVFEHLEAPWLVALQVQRILMVGGIVLISAPAIWPEHAAPNDFWRMSTFGLASMFGERLGFDVIASGGFGTVSVVPGDQMREQHTSMPVLYGPSHAYVLARKHRDVATDVDWPYDSEVGGQRARRYPLDAVEAGRWR